MGATQKILIQYTQLRKQGKDVRETLDVLRASIDSLSDDQQLELARRIRAQETGEEPDPTTAPLSPIQPIDPQSSEVEDTEVQVAIEWIACPHCGKSNQQGEVMCYACGQMLVSGTSKYQTQVLAPATDLTPAADHFGSDAVLLLTAHNSQKTYELRPQEREAEWILGRSTRHSPMNPDLDLGDSDGNRLGISRLHLSIRYDNQYQTLTVCDLGSANGSFLNGQRLHPHEVRVLRDQDELRLGHMMLMVAFKQND